MTEAYDVAAELLTGTENEWMLRSLEGPRKHQVEVFHELYECPIADATPDKEISHMTPERIAMRLGLIIEEVQELLAAFGVGTKIYYVDPKPSSATWINCGYYKDLVTAVRCGKQDGSFDVYEAADALGDISYVVDGFAIEAGVNLDDVINEIHASNLTKLGADGKPIYREDGKVLKGPRYTPPNIEKVI